MGESGVRTAAIYCRISRDREGAGLGVERQEAECRQLAERLGWAVAAVHTDNDLSAYKGKSRPGYEALLGDVAAGRANAVLAWHTDRLHRRNSELERFIDVIGATPVHTVQAGPLDLSTPTGRMQARIVGAVAQHESEHKSERLKSARAQAARAGKPGGGAWRPFGYTRAGELESGEAAELAAASDAILAGSSLRGIVRDWNSREIRTSRGNEWIPETLRDVLIRPRNAGISTHNNEEVGLGDWPAIISEDTFRAVVATLTDPARRTTPGNTRKHLLSGVALCGVCGDVVRVAGSVKAAGKTTMGHGGHWPRYRCASGRHISRQVAMVDELITVQAIGRLSQPDATDLVTQPAGDNPDPAELSGQATTLRSRLDSLAESFADGEITRAQLTAGTARLKAKLEAVETELARAAETSPLIGLAGADDVAELWEKLDLGRRQAVIKSLMTIHIDPRKGRGFDSRSVRIEWRVP